MRGIEADPDLAERLTHAETTACIRIAGTAEGVTLLFDRDPPQIRPAPEPTEIEIENAKEDARNVLDGEELPPLLLLSGRALHRGPVRRVLRVAPILRPAPRRRPQPPQRVRTATLSDG